MRQTVPVKAKDLRFQWKNMSNYLNFLDNYSKKKISIPPDQACRASTVMSDLMTIQTAQGVLDNLLREGNGQKLRLFFIGLTGEYRDKITELMTAYLLDEPEESIDYDSAHNTHEENIAIARKITSDEEITNRNIPRDTGLISYLCKHGLQDYVPPVGNEKSETSLKSLFQWVPLKP